MVYADTLGKSLERLLWGYPELLKEFIEEVQPAMIEDREQNEKAIREQANKRLDGTLKNDEDDPRNQSQNGDQDEKACLDLPGMSSDPPNTPYARSGSPVLAQEDGQPEDLPSGTKTGYAEPSSPPETRPQLHLDDAEIAGEASARSDTKKSLQIPETKIDKGKRKATEEMDETE